MAPYTLLQHGPVWGLPSGCTTCIFVQTYLKLAAVPYNVYDCNDQPDTELPLLQVSVRLPSPESPADVSSSTSAPSLSTPGAPSTPASESTPSEAPQEAVSSDRESVPSSADRTIEVVQPNPLQWLKDMEGIDLDSPLLDNERVELQAFSALLDPLLSDATQFTLWMEADNYAAAVEAYCGHLPWPLTAFLGWQKRRGVQLCFRQGAMKEVKDSSRLYGRAADAYKALSSRLGNSKYFFTERPTSMDAALFAHLIFHLRAPLSVAPMREAILKHPNLVKYAEAMEAELFQCAEGVVREAPLFTRTGVHNAPAARGNPGKEKEERNMWKKNALFVGAQITAIVGVLGLATLTMVSDGEMAEEDMEDEEEEEEEE